MSEVQKDKSNDESNGFYKLSWVQRIGYGAGDMAQNFIFQTIMGYILFFYSDVYVLTGNKEKAIAIGATLNMTATIVDIIWDPMVGALVDKLNPKLGKYRSWLIYGGIPLTIASALSFWDGFKPALWYAILTYTVMRLSYTLVNVPYGALNASLTRDTHEITVLTSVRMFMANFAGFLVNAGILIFVSIFSGKGITKELIEAAGYKALGSLPSFIFLSLLPAIKSKVGKKNVFYIFLSLAIIGYMMIYVVISIGIDKYKWLLYIAQFVKSSGVCIATGYMWALVPEVISFAEYTTGRRIAGIVNALTGIFFKAGMGLGGALPGWILGALKYKSPDAAKDGDVISTNSNAWFFTMLIYIVFGFILLIFCFTQTKERVVMDKDAAEGVKWYDLFVEFVRNRPLRILALYFIFAFTFMFVGNSSENYFINSKNMAAQTGVVQEGIRWCACVIPSIIAACSMIWIYLYELTDEKIDEINMEIEKRNKA
jgi:Na+/melibiose symporter-like transporter